MLTEVLPSSMVLSRVLTWKEGWLQVLLGKLVPSGLMTGGAPERKCLEEIRSSRGQSRGPCQAWVPGGQSTGYLHCDLYVAARGTSRGHVQQPAKQHSVRGHAEVEEPGAAIPAVEGQLLWGLGEVLRYQASFCR